MKSTALPHTAIFAHHGPPATIGEDGHAPSPRPLFALASAVMLMMACQPPPSDGFPAWCRGSGELELSCSGPECAAVVVVDYARREPRGYRLFNLSGSPISAAEAEKIAVKHVVERLGAEVPSFTDVNPTDRRFDWYYVWLSYPNNDSWLVIIHAATGTVVFAGLEVWANPERGADPPLLSGYLPADGLACTDGTDAPADKLLVNTGAPTASPAKSTPSDALAVVRRLNLTEQFTKSRDYHALVISYSPAIGEFDARAADWYVWLSLGKPATALPR